MFSRRSAIKYAALTCVTRSGLAQYTPLSSPINYLAGQFNWYVDSVNGNDSNTGRSPAQAFQTIGHLLAQSVTSGQSIGLASQSYFNDAIMTCPATFVSVHAYGQYSFRQNIAAGAWSKTAGATNVYQITLPISGIMLGAGSFIYAWEDATRPCGLSGQLLGPIAMLPMMSVVLCDGQAGSFFVSGATLYAHAWDSSSLASNGYTYFWKSPPMLDSANQISANNVGWAAIPGFANMYAITITLPPTAGEARTVRMWDNGSAIKLCASSLLSSGITSAATVLPLTAAISGAANGDVWLINNEQVQVVSGAATTSVTVTRGYNSTTAAAQASGASVVSVTNCQANANGSGCGAVSGTTTLICHPSDGSNPGSNGRIYEYTARNFGFDCYSNTNCSAYGLATQKGLNNNGSLSFGRFGYGEDCIANFGGKHNIYCRTGSSLYGCAALEFHYSPGIGSIMFVFNEDTPNGEGVTFAYCQCRCSTGFALGSLDTAIDGHVNVSGSFGTVASSYCYVEYVGFAYGGNTNQNLYYCGTLNCTGDGGTNLIITGGNFVGCVSGLSLTPPNAGVYTWTGLTISTSGPTSEGIVKPNTTGITINLTNCVISRASGLFSGCVGLNNASTWIVNGCTFTTTGQYYNSTSAGSSITADNNVFASGNLTNAWNAEVGGMAQSYSTLTAWQVASGQDTHSTL